MCHGRRRPATHDYIAETTANSWVAGPSPTRCTHLVVTAEQRCFAEFRSESFQAFAAARHNDPIPNSVWTIGHKSLKYLPFWRCVNLIGSSPATTVPQR